MRRKLNELISELLVLEANTNFFPSFFYFLQFLAFSFSTQIFIYAKFVKI